MCGVESIKRIRKARGMTLRELADRTGLLGPALARAERPGVDPRASTVVAIAKALGVPVCKLFEESGHERQGRKRKGKR
jgi:transcriptional regulator with XRE-family HTH domain